MEKSALTIIGITLLAALLIGFTVKFAFVDVNPSISATNTPPSTSNANSVPKQYTYTVIKTYPHDTTAFTEGLTFEDNGTLIESTGLYGDSTLRQVDLKTGNVSACLELNSQYFGEGITIVNNTIVQLTWQSEIGFVYDKENFTLVGNFSYPTEGWGLTFDGENLVMSDGSATLYFLDPVNYSVVRQVTVYDDGNPVSMLNELEYVNGTIYANIWQENRIAVIDPQSGQVEAWIDLDGLYSLANANDCLNGIAYDSQNGVLIVTGKDWPELYQIQLVPTD